MVQGETHFLINCVFVSLILAKDIVSDYSYNMCPCAILLHWRCSLYRLFFTLFQIILTVTNLWPLINFISSSCGSVLAILEIQSTGFYSVDALSEIIMSELADGRLGTLGVSVSGSSLTALSCEYDVHIIISNEKCNVILYLSPPKNMETQPLILSIMLVSIPVLSAHI